MALESTLEVEPSEKTMRYYCTLVVRSNSEQSATNIFKQDARAFLSFEDLHTRSNMTRRAQTFAGNASIQFVERNDLPRYECTLESKVGVDCLDPDPYVHVKWLLSHLKRGTSLAVIQKQGVECTLSFYWGGQGTGGGPVITPKLAALLGLHELRMDIGFYFEDD